MLLMEKAILGKLDWYLTVPTPYVFLARYIKASVPADKEVKINHPPPQNKFPVQENE